MEAARHTAAPLSQTRMASSSAGPKSSGGDVFSSMLSAQGDRPSRATAAPAQPPRDSKSSAASAPTPAEKSQVPEKSRASDKGQADQARQGKAEAGDKVEPKQPSHAAAAAHPVKSGATKPNGASDEASDDPAQPAAATGGVPGEIVAAANPPPSATTPAEASVPGAGAVPAAGLNAGPEVAAAQPGAVPAEAAGVVSTLMATAPVAMSAASPAEQGSKPGAEQAAAVAASGGGALLAMAKAPTDAAQPAIGMKGAGKGDKPAKDMRVAPGKAEVAEAAGKDDAKVMEGRFADLIHSSHLPTQGASNDSASPLPQAPLSSGQVGDAAAVPGGAPQAASAITPQLQAAGADPAAVGMPQGTSPAPAADNSARPVPSHTTPAPYASPAHQIAPVAVALSLGTGGDGPSKLSISLDPIELGRVEVIVEKAADVASVHIVAERPETLSMLQRDARDLDRALQQAGVGGQDRSMTFSLASDNSGAGRGGFERNGGRGGSDRHGVPASDLGPAAAATPIYGRLRPISLLDIAV